MTRGAFIVLEGIDRSGKSSQAIKLVETLKNTNIKAEIMSFPDRKTNTGQLISKYLSDNEYELNHETIHLLFSANRWENADLIRNKILSGITLIVDRYSYSGVAYSTAKGLNMNWCLQPEIGLPQPDLVFFLDINPEDLRNRPGYGRERYENLPMQVKVSNVYKQFAKRESYWKTVYANRAFNDIQNDLLAHVKQILRDIEQHETPLSNIKEFELKENIFDLKNGYQIINGLKNTLV